VGHGVWLVFASEFIYEYNTIGISQFVERCRGDARKPELKEEREGALKGGYFSLLSCIVRVGTWVTALFSCG